MPDGGSGVDLDDPSRGRPSPLDDSAAGDVPTALFACLTAWQQADSWGGFIQALVAVKTAALQAGHLALHDVCIALHERIEQISAAHERPDDEQCAVLASWPSFALAWVESPGDRRQAELLVEFLRHPMWPQPLDADEAESLHAMLVVERGEHGSESLIQAVIEDMDSPDDESDAPPGGAFGKETADDDAGDADGLPGYDGLSGYAKIGTALPGGGKIVPDVRACVASGLVDGEVEDLSAELDLGMATPVDEPESPPRAETQSREPVIPESAPPESEAADLAHVESELAESVFEALGASDAMQSDATEPGHVDPVFDAFTFDASAFAPPEPAEPPEPDADQAAFVEFEDVEPAFDASAFDAPEPTEPDTGQIPRIASEQVGPAFEALEPTERAPADTEPLDTALDETALAEHGERGEDDETQERFEEEGADVLHAGDKPGALPDGASEMIELLISEASHIATVLGDIMPLAIAEDAHASERREALQHFAEQVERFNGAVELLGLEGLNRAGQHFHRNIHLLAEGSEALRPELAELLVHVCAAVPEYLENPADPASAAALTALLADACWPQPAQTDWSAETERLLASPVVDFEDEEAEQRAVTALPEDVSLELPDDVDTEVLDGLLQDLPGQTAEFSGTVASLTSGGTVHDVELAQRIAHTVKGAANTVGVVGLANLTHHLEDILLALGKHGVMPGPGLSEVLVRASDCLESMGEALLGQGAAPEDALDTLQSVLDWANTIDSRGIEAVAGEAMPVSQTDTSQRAEHEEASNAAAVTATPMVRVPAPLVDDLLRLVGETIILTGQIQERLEVTSRETQNLRKQYTLVQQLGQEMEELVDLQDLNLPQQRVVNGEAFDALEFDQYNELHTCSRRLVEAATDTKEVGQNIEEHVSALKDMLSDQSRLNRENQEAVLKTRMVAVQTIVPRLQRSVRQASRLADKAVELRCIGTDTLIDSDVLGRLLDPLMHVLRNAVAHGIESQEARAEAGKDTTGEVRLEFQREGNHIVVRCTDDGAGLNLDAIREAARARDIVGENEHLSEEELVQLVLRPNFSTRTEATQLSGRGIGLDAVNTQVVGLGGSLRLQSSSGEGCQVIMRLPLTLVSTHALLVRVTSHVLAVATRGVEQILHPDAGELSHFGDQTTYRMVDAVYPCTSLTRLLGLPGERRTEDREHCPALMVQADNGLTVVLVDGVVDSRELVIKSMGRHLPKIRGIAGATILGDGSVTPVLDLPELLREPARRSWERPEKPGDITGIDVNMPYALVVDDSLSARRSLAQFMTDSGFQVRTARDGIEAVKIMQSRHPDVLLVDLEMPRMNGLELTHHVRANEETSDVPVIMITSRSTQKHRKQAEAAGVTHYVTKPYVEDELMEHVYSVCTKK